MKYLSHRPLAAYIVPSRDQHNSEYIAARDERRAFVSGFTGSAGVAVVTVDKALMWTDGRYHAQAEAEMDHNWTLVKEGLPEAPSRGEWLCANLDPGSAVGVDPFLMTQTEYASLSAKLKPEGSAIDDIYVDLDCHAHEIVLICDRWCNAFIHICHL